MIILDDILLSPITFVAWLSEKILEAAEYELTDDTPIKERLMELQLKFEMDEISEEEYDEGEKILLQQLDEINKRKEDKQQLQRVTE